MRNYISKKTRNAVTERAGFKCEYCLLSEKHSFLSFHIEHIISIKHGGGNELENLALACSHCNTYKGTDFVTFLDHYDDIVSIFNPRKESWSDHFSIDKGAINPLTRKGKATIKLLKLNESERLQIRNILSELGLYP